MTSPAIAGTASFVFHKIKLPNNTRPIFIDDANRIYAEEEIFSCYRWQDGNIRHSHFCPRSVSGNGTAGTVSDHGTPFLILKNGQHEIINVPGIHGRKLGPVLGVNNSQFAVGWGGNKTSGGWIWKGSDKKAYKLFDENGKTVFPGAINNKGDFAGANYDHSQVFIYQNGTYTYGSAGQYPIAVYYMNENGMIGGGSGSGYFIGSSAKGFTLIASDGYLMGVGAGDQAVGYIIDDHNNGEGFVLVNGTYYTINLPGTQNGTYIVGTNKKGSIVGYYSPDEGRTVSPFYATCASPDTICTK